MITSAQKMLMARAGVAVGAGGGNVDGVLDYTLDNPNAYSTSATDYFGYSVSTSESYAIVGAIYEDDGGGDAGKAYIYSTATGALLYTLDDPNAYGTSANDWFGYSVSISESYAIVGATNEGDAGGDWSGVGVAYIFSTATGALLYTLDNPNAYSFPGGDNFGSSVSISESYAIVGAHFEDDAGGSSSGKAYIFSTATGTLLYTLDNPNAYGTSASDYFSTSVSISESYAIVGAYREDDGYSDAGKAYIFSTATGALLYTLDNPNAYGTSNKDQFGQSVSITESYAIVGAPLEDDAGGSSSGKAYIFSTATGALLYTLDNPNPVGTSASDQFGYSVSISESYAIVGVYLEDETGGYYSSGKAYIYSTSTGSLLYTLDNPNAYGTIDGDQFGYSVSISESYAIVGAHFEDDAGGSSSGKAYIFT